MSTNTKHVIKTRYKDLCVCVWVLRQKLSHVSLAEISWMHRTRAPLKTCSGSTCPRRNGARESWSRYSSQPLGGSAGDKRRHGHSGQRGSTSRALQKGLLGAEVTGSGNPVAVHPADTHVFPLERCRGAKHFILVRRNNDFTLCCQQSQIKFITVNTESAFHVCKGGRVST